MPSFKHLFSQTSGDISAIFDDGELLSRDYDQFALLACAYPDALLDMTTDAGEQVGLIIEGDPLAMYPPPSFIVEGGGLYLNNGNPRLGQTRGQLYVPMSIFEAVEDQTRFYSLADLSVQELPQLKFNIGSGISTDPATLKGRSATEKKHLTELDKTMATGFLGNQFRVIFQPDKSKPPKFLAVRDAREREAKRVVEVKGDGGGTQKRHMFNEWKEWEGRRDFDEIKFMPGSDDPAIYNLFRGWSVRPIAGNWSLLRQHMHQMVCNGSDEHFDWLFTWLAFMFQRPQEKPTVAVVIRGKKGTGKSIIFDMIQRLMKPYFYKIADGRRALGNFNAQYETTLLLLFEEAIWAGDQAKESILKDLITSPTIAIEREGIDPYMAPNYMRIAMLSNERWVVPASHDERRFAVFDCGDQHRNDGPYFEAMVAQMNEGGTNALLYDLLTHQPPKGWSILRTAPATSGLREQVVESLRGVHRMAYELASTGRYECDQLPEGGIFLSEGAATQITMTDFRTAVRDYLADRFPGERAANFGLLERVAVEWFAAEVAARPGKQNKQTWVTFPPRGEIREHLRRTKGLDLAGTPSA